MGPINRILSNNLRRHREAAGWNQGQVAERIGIKRSRYGAYEDQRGITPPIEVLIAMAEVFGLNGIDDLLIDPIKAKKKQIDPVLMKYRHASKETRKIVDYILKIKK